MRHAGVMDEPQACCQWAAAKMLHKAEAGMGMGVPRQQGMMPAFPRNARTHLASAGATLVERKAAGHAAFGGADGHRCGSRHW